MLMKSGGDETCRIGKGGLAALHFTEGFTYDLLGQASAFAALTGDAKGGSYITVAAAAFVDGFANLTVSYTFAETDVHD